MSRPRQVEPGDRFAEGVACQVHDDGVLLGRPAGRDEVCPPGHREFQFGEHRVFMYEHSAPHPLHWLHPL